MKLKLEKKELVTLSQDDEVLAHELTPQVAGGTNNPGDEMPSGRLGNCTVYDGPCHRY